MASLANNPAIWKNLRNEFPNPYALEHAEGFIGRCLREEPPLTLLIEADGLPAGVVGISRTPEDDLPACGEIGFWIGEPFWGRGIATEAVGLMADYAFQDLGLRRLFGLVFQGNDASCRVFEKLAFRHEGTLRSAYCKNGEVIDLHLYAKLHPTLEERLP